MCLTACEHDTWLENPPAIVDSLEAVMRRGPGAAGSLKGLFGIGWKGVEVIDGRTLPAKVELMFGKSAARAFDEVHDQAAGGTVLVFGFMHNCCQAVVVPSVRAQFDASTVGRSFGSYSTYVVDSAGRIVIHRPR
jgi:hypothetical protein